MLRFGAIYFLPLFDDLTTFSGTTVGKRMRLVNTLDRWVTVSNENAVEKSNEIENPNEESQEK